VRGAVRAKPDQHGDCERGAKLKHATLTFEKRLNDPQV